MSGILVLFAHPRYENSRVQQRLSMAAQRIPGLTFHDLYELYPDFDVSVPREQELLIRHDIVILQHPFYWYGCPPLMKQWLDLVLEHGWAYGKAGRALHGKIMLNAITTGGRQEAYLPGGFNKYTIGQFLAPFEQTARLCNMKYYPPFVIHGTHMATTLDIDRAGESYGRVLEGLAAGTFSVEDIGRVSIINDLVN